MVRALIPLGKDSSGHHGGTNLKSVRAAEISPESRSRAARGAGRLVCLFGGRKTLRQRFERIYPIGRQLPFARRAMGCGAGLYAAVVRIGRGFVSDAERFAKRGVAGDFGFGGDL